MSTETPNLLLQYLDASQAEPEVKINDAWNKIDAALLSSGGGLSVSDATTSPAIARAVREIKFAGATVTHETNGVARVHFDTVSDIDAGGGGSAPGGANYQIQYNAAGALGGIALGTSGYVLTSNGPGATPTMQELPAAAATAWTIKGEAANYALILADGATTYIRMSSASDNGIQIPTNATAAIPIGSITKARQAGVGQTQIVTAAGVTLNVPSGYYAAARAQGSWFELIKVGTDEWDLAGDLSTGAPAVITGPFDLIVSLGSFSGFDITVPA